MLPIRCGAALALMLPGSLLAQLEPPSDWRSVPDRPARLQREQHKFGEPMADSLFRFVMMPPGYHITMGPGALLFPADRSVRGNFTLQSEMFLFAESVTAEYGLFLGGTELEAGNARYTAFVLRGDGAAAVVRREGDSEAFLHPWTRQEAVVPHPNDGQAVIKNVLRITADAAEVSFWANGLLLAAVPRAQAPVDGSFGFRSGRGVNLHVSTLDLTERLAPPRRR